MEPVIADSQVPGDPLNLALPVLSVPNPSGCFDPRDFGARCADCILAPFGPGKSIGLEVAPENWKPVASEIRESPDVVLVGMSPGQDECLSGRPFTGPSGSQELWPALAQHGYKRAQFSVLNVLSCMPPKFGAGGGDSNELEKIEHAIGKYNRAAASAGLPPLLKPDEACRPRLALELNLPQHRNFITLGSRAAKALLGQVSMEAVRGTPIDGYLDDQGYVHRDAPPFRLDGKEPPSIKLVATWHPALLLPGRMPRWRGTFIGDLGRALRFFRGALRWKEPRFKLVNPDPATLEKWLFSQRWATVDVETAPTRDYPDMLAEQYWTEKGLDGEERKKRIKERKQFLYDPLRARLACVGFGTPNEALVVGISGIKDLNIQFYSDDELQQIWEILTRWATWPDCIKVTWNGIGYDHPVLKRYLNGAWLTPRLDLIYGQRLVASELPKSLAFAASLYLDYRAWKAENIGLEAPDDESLHAYNLEDDVIEARVAEPILTRIVERKQDHLLEIDERIGEMCAGLHEVGLPVDQRAVHEWDYKLDGLERHWARECQEISGSPRMNPHSTRQMVDLLFDRWGLPVKSYTDGGEPSTDEPSLIKLIVDPTVQGSQKRFCHALRRVRKYRKLRTSGVQPYMPAPRGFCAKDGRVHATILAHSVLSGRLAASNPAILTLPERLRNVVKAPTGYKFVGVDADQLELRFATGLSQAQYYLKAFRDGLDPHGMLAEMVWKDDYRKAAGHVPGDKPKKGTLADRMRHFAKITVFASIYAAELPTIHEQIAGSEDENFELIFADFSLRQTRLVVETWKALVPEIAQWWDRCKQFYRVNGYITEPVLGRRRDCLDGEDIHELSNFQNQSGAAGFMATVALGLGGGVSPGLLERFPFHHWGEGTGLCLQLHDNYTMLVPDAVAEDVRDQLTLLMRREFSCLPGVVLTGSAKIGETWAEV